jgi:hypothetical protein
MRFRPCASLDYVSQKNMISLSLKARNLSCQTNMFWCEISICVHHFYVTSHVRDLTSRNFSKCLFQSFFYFSQGLLL